MKSGNTKSNKGYSAFISHASEDREIAETIVSELESKGLSCWIAPRNVRIGHEYPKEIIHGIERSKCFVLVVSDSANESGHVSRELERACSRGKPIYPVRVKDVPLSPTLEYFISMHHWLDAYDGMLREHTEVLATAIESQEVWIGNEVIHRQRRFKIRSSIGLVLAATVLVTGIIFSGDIRSFFQNEQEKAITTMGNKGIPVSIGGLEQAIAGVAVEDLTTFLKSGISSQQLNKAFEKSADDFFKSSKNNRPAIKWLKSALEYGLNPNLITSDDYYDKVNILVPALRAGNVEAALTLLKAGASPHPYQNLWFSKYSEPRFLFPYGYLKDNVKLNEADKTRLAEAYKKAGAVIVELIADKRNHEEWRKRVFSLSMHKKAVEQVFSKAETIFEFSIHETPSACEGRSTTPICQAATKATGRDWCNIMEMLPVRVTPGPKNNDFRLGEFDIHFLLNVVDAYGYVLVTDTTSSYGGYALLEISADLKHWNLYKYITPQAGMGHCKADSDGYVPKNCWRRWELTYIPEKAVVRVSDYYDYKALFDCSSKPTRKRM